MKTLDFHRCIEGFCVKGSPLYVGNGVKRIISFIKKKILEYNKRGEYVIFFVDAHDEDALE